MPTTKQIRINHWNPTATSGPRSAPFNFAPGRGFRPKPKREYVPDESPAELNELADEYYRHYRPESPAERDIVDSMVENQWLLRGCSPDSQEADFPAMPEL